MPRRQCDFGQYRHRYSLDGANCTQNAAAGNWIGTDSNGFTAIPNQYGIVITNGAHHNLIGNDGDGQGDMEERIDLRQPDRRRHRWGGRRSHNTVAGNWIGTNDDGSGALANTRSVSLFMALPENLIGGQVGNFISGNRYWHLN